MKDFDIKEEEVVELGQASTETKGDADFQIYVSIGQAF